MPSGLVAGTVAGAPLWLWIAFHALVLCLLIADFLLTRDAVPRKTVERRSFWLTGCWVAAALLFALVVGRALSPADGIAYLTGYGIEEALSIDNLFVFVVLFRLFRLDSADQRRVLFYGVLGAIVLRGAMIFAGIALLDNVRPRELDARAGINIEPVDVLGATGIRQVEYANHEVPVGDHRVVDQRVETSVPPVRRQTPAMVVFQLQDRAQLRIEPLRPAVNHDALTGFGVKPKRIDVARHLDHSAE